MHTNLNFPKSWSTASASDSADTSPLELKALGEHLGLCRNPSGPMFALHCAAQCIHSFVISRFVTTLLVVAVLLGIASLLG